MRRFWQGQTAIHEAHCPNHLSPEEREGKKERLVRKKDGGIPIQMQEQDRPV